MTTTVTCPVCEQEIEVEVEWIPGEMYGSDADGNRGMWVEGYAEAQDFNPCDPAHPLTEAQITLILKDAEDRANEAAAEPDWGEPEDMEDR